MEIKLKNVLISERLSGESLAFSANLYIGEASAGMAGNKGQGDPTIYFSFGSKGDALIKEAEKFCNALPPRIIEYPFRKGDPQKQKMDLEKYIDNMVNEHYKRMRVEMDLKLVKKHERNCIVYGMPGLVVGRLKYDAPISRMIKDKTGVALLRADIENKILPLLSDGKKILNTNISKDAIKTLGIPPDKIVPRIVKDQSVKWGKTANSSKKKGRGKGLK